MPRDGADIGAEPRDQASPASLPTQQSSKKKSQPRALNAAEEAAEATSGNSLKPDLKASSKLQKAEIVLHHCRAQLAKPEHTPPSAPQKSSSKGAKAKAKAKLAAKQQAAAKAQAAAKQNCPARQDRPALTTLRQSQSSRYLSALDYCAVKKLGKLPGADQIVHRRK